MYPLDWILVQGGTGEIGDRKKRVLVKSLFWTVTPITRGHLGDCTGIDLPCASIDFARALEIARLFDARLPTSVEWEWMAAGPQRSLYPWGDADWTPAHANLRDSHVGGPTPVGSFPLGRTRDGLLDVAGNVWEWTSSPVFNLGAIIRGGCYDSPTLYARTVFLNAAPCELSSPGIGVRLVRDV